METLERLTAVLKERKTADVGSSYVASLYRQGLDAILKKVGEEAAETIVAAKNAATPGRNAALVHEVADLWFHSLVLLVHLDQEPQWVLEELDRRAGVSGLTEKLQRPSTATPRNP